MKSECLGCGLLARFGATPTRRETGGGQTLFSFCFLRVCSFIGIGIWMGIWFLGFNFWENKKKTNGGVAQW